jgi:hypothetical protein
MRTLIPLVLLAGCTKDAPETDTDVADTDVAVDTDVDTDIPQTPVIAAASPPSGRVGVGTATAITVTFSEEMRLATVTTQEETDGGCAGTLQLTVGPEYTVCIGLHGTTADNRTFTLTPAAPLANETSYRLAATEGLASEAGPPLAPVADVTTFRTTKFPEDARILYPATTDGDMGGAAGADAKCLAATPLPVGVTAAKAMLTDATRVACSVPQCGDGNTQLDWALSSDTHYVRSDGEFLFTTDANGIFAFPMEHDLGSEVNFWDGLNVDFTSITPNCTDWTSNAADQTGRVGFDLGTSESWLFGGEVSCDSTRPVLCAEQ